MRDSIFLVLGTPHLGHNMTPVRSPFGGTTVPKYDDQPLTDDECEAVLSIIKEVSNDGPDDGDFYYFRYSKDRYVGFGARDLRPDALRLGVEVELVGHFDLDMAELTFQLASAANLLVMSATRLETVASISDGIVSFKDRWPAAPILPSPKALMAWIQQCRKKGMI